MDKIVFTAGIFDMMHKGHLRLLRKMKEKGTVVVVLHDDRSCFLIKDKVPIQSLEQRVKNLEISGLVDHILVTESIDPADQFGLIIGTYKNNLLFIRGDDNKTYPGKWIVDQNNIKTELVKYTEGISSTKMRDEL